MICPECGTTCELDAGDNHTVFDYLVEPWSCPNCHWVEDFTKEAAEE